MRTVVILHGWGHSSAQWRGAVAGGDVAVRVFDLPGFGNEALVSADWGISEYAEWVRRKIEAEGLSDVVLLGHSFGGRIAAELASTRHSWLSGLILYAAPCLYRPTNIIAAKKSIAKVARAFGLGGRYRGNPELGAADKAGLGSIYRRVVNFDQTDALRNIFVPTLLIWGERDVDVPLRIAREMETLIPQSRLEVLPGLGHNAHLENPNLFYGVIKKYVQNF